MQSKNGLPEKAPLSKLMIGDTVYETQFTEKFERRRRYVPADPKRVVCVIPGIIQSIRIHPSQKVVRDESLMVLEAMKMQNDILCPLDGRVKAVHVKVGQMVTKGELLAELE
jgi:pyruvate carboxylase